jgi:hypothetical protein
LRARGREHPALLEFNCILSEPRVDRGRGVHDCGCARHPGERRAHEGIGGVKEMVVVA